MPRRTSARAFLTLLALFALATRPSPAPADDEPGAPYARDNQFAGYDVRSFRAGDWAEYETHNSRDEAYRSRLACVKADDDAAWVELSGREFLDREDDVILLVRVQRATGRVTHAWWGKAGEEGKAVDVDPASQRHACGTYLKETSISVTGRVSREKVAAAGAELECEKTEARTTVSGRHELKYTTTTWLSANAPFPRLPDAGAASERPLPNHTYAWETPKPTLSGGLVKLREAGDRPEDMMTVETVLAAKGTDAKARLQVK